MKSAFRWVWIPLIATAAGCAAPNGAANGNALLGPATTQFAPVARGHIEGPSTVPAGNGFDEEFDLLDEELVRQMTIADPLEDWNRRVHRFNDAAYYRLALPILEGYAELVPEEVRIALRNFFHNWTMPIRLVNCLLQGKWAAAEVELFRFAVNTTVGVLGFRDAALEIHGVGPVEEDLGQTLAVWGFDSGCYLVWPLLGPSTLRDSIGALGDGFLDPLRYVEPWPVPLGVSALRLINDGSLQLGKYEAIIDDALDPYVAVRQAYIQYRAKKIRE